MNLTNDDVQEILRLLEASSFDELHIETDRFKLTLRRSASKQGGWTQERHTLAAAQSNTAQVAGADTSATSGSATPGNTGPASQSDASSNSDGIIDVRAPIIGTFYRAPKPGAPAFVEVGSQVKADTVIGIVETMKLMNSVYAGTRGEVVEICATNAAFVEQDHVLMRIRPTDP